MKEGAQWQMNGGDGDIPDYGGWLHTPEIINVDAVEL